MIQYQNWWSFPHSIEIKSNWSAPVPSKNAVTRPVRTGQQVGNVYGSVTPRSPRGNHVRTVQVLLILMIWTIYPIFDLIPICTVTTVSCRDLRWSGVYVPENASIHQIFWSYEKNGAKQEFLVCFTINNARNFVTCFSMTCYFYAFSDPLARGLPNLCTLLTVAVSEERFEKFWKHQTNPAQQRPHGKSS